MSSMFFSSSSENTKKVGSETVVDVGKLFMAFNDLKKNASIQETELFKKDIYIAFEKTKVNKNKENSTPMFIDACKNYFEHNIEELLKRAQSYSSSIAKSNLAILVISFYNYFDNIEGDNNKTLLGDAAPLSTKNAVNNFIKACDILEKFNPKIKPMVATVDIEDNHLSARNSQYNDLASSISQVNLAQSTASDENIPYATSALPYGAQQVQVAQVVEDTSEINTVINKYKNISDYATLSIFGNLEKNALSIYLQRYRVFPILDAATSQFHARTVHWNDYQILDNQNFSKYIPILNLLANILIVYYSNMESLIHKEYDSKREMRWGKIKEEIKALQEYVQTANLIPENISYLRIGIPPKKSWMDFHHVIAVENPEFAKTTCAQAYKEVIQCSRFFKDKGNKQFLEKILPVIINGEKTEIEIKRKSSILKRLMGE